jgi:RND family efflux transporter MFP subunit
MKHPTVPRTATQLRTSAAMVAGMFLAACAPQKEVVVAEPTPVRLAAASEGPAQPPLEATGVVAARDELRLSFKAGGVVQRVAVREGDSVRKGQLLAALDPTEVSAQVEQAQQLAEKAERDLARGAALQADQVIPMEQLQNLQTQADVARAQLKAARFNQQFTSISAPSDGVVLKRMTEERELAAPGQVVLIIGRNDGGHVVRFSVADRSIVQLRVGDAVELRLDAWPAEVFKAVVTQLSGSADPATGLFQVEARIEAAKQPLVSGLVGRARLSPGASTAKLPYVPIGAVLEGHGDRAQVFIADGDVARRRDVEVAFITADSVAIRSGIKVGEQVIATGAPYLEDGGRIAIAP